MLITKIEIQKKKKNYFNLYTAEEIYLFSITEETLLKFGISKGNDYTSSELKEIQAYDAKMRCVYQAYRYLSRRPHLEGELKRKLKEKKYDQKTIESAIDYLTEHKYLDDSDFIKTFIEEQIRQKKIGPLLLKKKLVEKGAMTNAFEPILSQRYPEELQTTNALYLFDHKIKHVQEVEKKKIKQKLYHYLQQKGYTWPVIEKVFKLRLSADESEYSL